MIYMVCVCVLFNVDYCSVGQMPSTTVQNDPKLFIHIYITYYCYRYVRLLVVSVYADAWIRTMFVFRSEKFITRTSRTYSLHDKPNRTCVRCMYDVRTVIVIDDLNIVHRCRAH